MDTGKIKELIESGDFQLDVHNLCDNCCELCIYANKCLNFYLLQKQFSLPDVDVETNSVFWKNLPELVDDFSGVLSAFASEVGFDNTAEIRDNIEEPFEKHRMLNKFNDYIKNANKVLSKKDKYLIDRNAQFGVKLSSFFSKNSKEEDEKAIEKIVYVLELYAELFPGKLVRSLHNRKSITDDFLFMDSVMAAKTALEMIDKMIYCWAIFFSYFKNQKYDILTVCLELSWIYYNLNKMFDGALEIKRPGIDK